MSEGTNPIAQLLGELKGYLEELAVQKGRVQDRRMTTKKVFAGLGKLAQISHLDSTGQARAAGKQINDVVITSLYESLPHPPTSLMQTDRFRQADGGRNNVYDPQLGQAGTAYARNVQGGHPLPPHSLPDPGLVFDQLLGRRGAREDHPGKNSSLTFAFAALVTHTLFRTKLEDWDQNNTSSYLDLSPLYGSNQEEQDAVRIKDGRGLLHPDTFSEERLAFLPPAAGALLVIWNRNHNFIATNILKINEQRRWTDPPPRELQPLKKQDDEIFETARLINCASFMSVILGDYVAGFLGTPRQGSAWKMEPFGPIDDASGRHVGRGEGNHVSVEFNLLYRWHATTSAADEAWTTGLFERIFPGKDPADLTLGEVYGAMHRIKRGSVADPSKRTFGRIKRGSDGRFSDKDLADILHKSTESTAGRFGARGIPPVLKIVEIMAMEQARKWGVCSLNEFRRFLGLKSLESFEEWNNNKEIADAARQLYGHIENLELYPGLLAEQTEEPGPGSGLCAGFTMTRAILSDAIALVRGDRFFTTDFTPTNLTCWGFQDVQADPNNGAFGAYLPKLLMRTLPRYYTFNSAYGLFPFFTPSASEENMKTLGLYDSYDFDPPNEGPIPKVLDDSAGIKHVFDDFDKYKVPYGPDMRYPSLTNNVGLFSIFDEDPKHRDARIKLMDVLYHEGLDGHVKWYRETLQTLIKDRTIEYDALKGGVIKKIKHIDVIRDVINPAAVRWVCEHICGISPGSSGNPSEAEMYVKLRTLFSCIFRNTEPHNGWRLRKVANAFADSISGIILKNLKDVDSNEACKAFYKQVLGGQEPTNDHVGTVLGLAIGSCANYAQAAAQVIDFYLDDKRREDLGKIIELCGKDDSGSDNLLIGYYREGARLNPHFPALLRVAEVDDTIPAAEDRPEIEVKKGDRLFCSLRNAYLDSKLFENPTRVNPNRDPSLYMHHATGEHHCPGRDFSEKTIPVTMRAIFGLKNVRRAQGDKGILQRITSNVADTEIITYVADSGQLSPWPESLVLQYDD